jgi:hypothetical protein
LLFGASELVCLPLKKGKGTFFAPTLAIFTIFFSKSYSTQRDKRSFSFFVVRQIRLKEISPFIYL